MCVWAGEWKSCFWGVCVSVWLYYVSAAEESGIWPEAGPASIHFEAFRKFPMMSKQRKWENKTTPAFPTL